MHRLRPFHNSLHHSRHHRPSFLLSATIALGLCIAPACKSDPSHEDPPGDSPDAGETPDAGDTSDGGTQWTGRTVNVSDAYQLRDAFLAAQPGDLILFPRHVGALVSDRGVIGMLDDADVMVHTCFARPREQSLRDSQWSQTRIEIRRW